jgi:hypothetical protein
MFALRELDARDAALAGGEAPCLRGVGIEEHVARVLEA